MHLGASFYTAFTGFMILAAGRHRLGCLFNELYNFGSDSFSYRILSYCSNHSFASPHLLIKMKVRLDKECFKPFLMEKCRSIHWNVLGEDVISINFTKV